MEGRVLYAALRSVPVPVEPVARLWHAATLLREHRGDGHVAALVPEGIGGTEAHVLHALSEGLPAEKVGRVHHLPAAQLSAVVDGMRARGLVDSSGWLSEADRETKERVESRTDDLAAAPYDNLSASARPARRGPRAHHRHARRGRVAIDPAAGAISPTGPGVPRAAARLPYAAAIAPQARRAAHDAGVFIRGTVGR